MIYTDSPAATLLLPAEPLSPSEFAERHLYLSPEETSLPGRWSNDVFPFLAPVMDACEEALRLGKTGVVIMKAGQIGGSRAVLNFMLWLKARYSGAILYMTATHDVAERFGAVRLRREDIERSEPLAAKAMFPRWTLSTKHFVDGALVLAGGKAVTAFESTPYPFVIIDEADSLADELRGRGDPIRNALIRTEGYRTMGSRTLVVVFAHPTTRHRHTGKLYYHESDQRRAFAPCPHRCQPGAEFWLDWGKQVKVEPTEGESREKAERDPRRYVWRAPCCGQVVSDADRVRMGYETRQTSTLAPDEAASKTWIGLHIPQDYARHHPLEELAADWIAGIDDESVRRVSVNKRRGDVFEPTTMYAGLEAWRACVRPEFARGTVPAWVQVLTAGTDQGGRALHWSIWGWGLVRDEATNAVNLQCCLVDWGTIPVMGATGSLEASDLVGFELAIYGRSFTRVGGGTMRVRKVLHDSGWGTIAVYEYCLRRIQDHQDARGTPCKGDRLVERKAVLHPVARAGSPPAWERGGVKIAYPAPLVLVNTYLAKQRLHEQAHRGLVWFPVEAGLEGEEVMEHLANERLAVRADGDREWVAATKRSHYLDTAVYAQAAASMVLPELGGRTHEQTSARVGSGSNEDRRSEAATGDRPPPVRYPGGVRRSY